MNFCIFFYLGQPAVCLLLSCLDHFLCIIRKAESVCSQKLELWTNIYYVKGYHFTTVPPSLLYFLANSTAASAARIDGAEPSIGRSILEIFDNAIMIFPIVSIRPSSRLTEYLGSVHSLRP